MDVIWVPFELHPATPEEGILLTERFGTEEFKTRLEDLTKRGQRWSLYYEGLERLANSHLALLAELYAVRQQSGETFRTAIYHAYFEEGLNIGRLEALLDIGEKVGLDRHGLQHYLQKADDELLAPAKKLTEQWSVNSVPTFVVADLYKVEGSDQEQILRNAIESTMKT